MRLLKMTVIMMLALASAVGAQVSTTASIQFTVNLIPMKLTAQNDFGSLFNSVSINNSWPDTIKSFWMTGEVIAKITDSSRTVIKINHSWNGVDASEIDTVIIWEQFKAPRKSPSGAMQDSLLFLVFNNQSPIVKTASHPGSSFKISWAPKENINVTQVPPDKMDSLTIITQDTISVSGADSSTSKAFPGRYGYITLWLTGTTTSADSTAFCAGIFYQVKRGGSSIWCGDLSMPGQNYFNCGLDSIWMSRGNTKEFWFSMANSGPVDSMRLKVAPKNSAYRAIITGVHVKWRD